MTDIVAFLRARLDEDEQVARAAPQGEPFNGQWVVDHGPTDQETIRTYNGWSLAYGHSNSKGNYRGLPPGFAAHVTQWDPARVIAEVEAKRRFLNLIPEIDNADRLVESEWGSGPEWGTMADRLLKLMTLPYADHPDYDPAWALNTV